ncbi:unnamed protein product [Sphagnum balticum]
MISWQQRNGFEIARINVSLETTMSSHFAASAIAEICSFRISCKMLFERDEYGSNIEKGFRGGGGSETRGVDSGSWPSWSHSLHSALQLWIVYCTTLAGRVLGTVDHLQPEGCQAGIGQGQKLACQYLVAADGAGSSVRELAGVQMEGDENLQKLISVHFMSKQLGQHLLDSVPGMLYFVFNQRVIAVIVGHNLEAGEFIAQIPFYPPQQQFEEFTEKVAKTSTALSIANFKAAMAVPAALGLDPSAARLNAVVSASPHCAMSWALVANKVTLLDGLFAIGRAQVSPAFLSSLNPIGSARVLEEQRILLFQYPLLFEKGRVSSSSSC